jgi:hypothetical protein
MFTYHQLYIYLFKYDQIVYHLKEFIKNYLLIIVYIGEASEKYVKYKQKQTYILTWNYR